MPEVTKPPIIEMEANADGVFVSKLDQAFTVDAHWAILGEYALGAESVLASLTPAMADLAAKAHAETLAARGDAEVDAKPYAVENGVAVLGLSGPMTKRPTSMSYYFGGTSTVKLGRAIRLATADASVKAILIKTSSPGGQVDGTSDLHDEIVRAKASKPVYAYVDGLMASAAMWALSPSNGIYAGRTAQVGAIGTYAVMRDTSRAAMAAGVEVVVIREGMFKGAGTPGTVLTDAHRQEFQREVAALNDHFVNDVAAGRGLTPERARELADGRVHVGQAAQDIGLIDGVMSFEECLTMISSGTVPDRKTAGNGTGATTMSNEPKQTVGDRIAAFFNGLGLDMQSTAAGTPVTEATPPVTPPATPSATTATTTPPAAPAADAPNPVMEAAFTMMANALVATHCGAMDPAVKEAVKPLALVAVRADKGEIGPACIAFQTLATNAKSPIDMTKPMIVTVAKSDPTAAAKLKADAAKVNAGAVNTINRGG